MTIFGPDISSYQNGLDLARLSAASFVIAKTTEGTYYTDSGYQGWRRQAAALGKPFVWYHFLSGEDAHAQVAHTAANLGDRSLPGMLDVEPAGSFRPSMSQVIAYVDAAAGAGLNLRLVYLPRWYWQQIGSPDLTALADRGLRLISSAYPGEAGSPAGLYPGDGAAGWQPYGGMTPLLYQYTNQAADGGQPLDYNAFRGTLPQLAALLGAAPTAPTGGSTMPAIPSSIGQKWPEIAGEFSGDYTDSMAIIWADAGGRAAALYARQARDEIRALAAHVGQPAPVDVVALAAVLGPMLHPSMNAEDVVAQLLPHLPGTPDPAEFAAQLAQHIKVV